MKHQRYAQLAGEDLERRRMLTDDFPDMIGPDVPLLTSRVFSGEITGISDRDYVKLELAQGDTVYSRTGSGTRSRILLQKEDGTGVPRSSATWNIEETGNYFLSTYAVVLDERGFFRFEIWVNDDHPNVIDSPNVSNIQLGRETKIALDTDDVDVFAFDVKQDEFYQFEVNVIYDRSFTFLNEAGEELTTKGRSDALSAAGKPWIFTWRPPSSGTHFVAITGSSETTFTVRLDGTDDISDTVTDTTPLIEYGEPTTGRTDANLYTDVDVFAFDGRQGDLVRATALFANVSLDFLNADGTEVIASSPGSELDWTVPADGRYHVAVSGFYSDQYELLLTSTVDDFLNQPSPNVVVLTPEDPISGRIDSTIDVDVFAFDGVLGNEYSFDVERASVISNSTIAILNEEGEQLASRFGSHIDWTPASSGRYYVSVQGTREVDYEVTMSNRQVGSMDLNEDGQVNSEDIDILFAAIRNESQDATFDINGDGTLDDADRENYLAQAGIRQGDADLNGSVDFGDFLLLSNNFGADAGWAEGDFDGSGTVDFADFLMLSSQFGE